MTTPNRTHPQSESGEERPELERPGLPHRPDARRDSSATDHMSVLLPRIGATAWATAILAGSVIPGLELPSPTFTFQDKLVHAVAYAVLAALCTLSIPRLRHLPAALTSISLAMTYGTLLEIIQGLFIPGRSFDLLDIAANAVGSVIGAVIITRGGLR